MCTNFQIPGPLTTWQYSLTGHLLLPCRPTTALPVPLALETQLGQSCVVLSVFGPNTSSTLPAWGPAIQQAGTEEITATFSSSSHQALRVKRNGLPPSTVPCTYTVGPQSTFAEQTSNKEVFSPLAGTIPLSVPVSRAASISLSL